MYRFFFSSLLILFVPLVSNAATLRLETPPTSVRVGDSFVVGLFLDTQSDVINALEGSLTFSPNLTLESIRYTGSLVPLWLTQPAQTKAGTISFAGVIPGGFEGAGAESATAQGGNVLTLVFLARATGSARIAYGSDTAVYKDDGEGTRAPLTTAPLSFAVASTEGASRTAEVPQDTIAPEPFTPIVSPGTPFGLTGSVLIFATQDKNSGVERYEYASSYDSTPSPGTVWQTVQSPFAIPQGDDAKFLFVRAVDFSGNMRLAIVPPSTVTAISLLHRFGLITFFFALCIVILIFRVKKRRS